jgi:hypothetical protein
MGCSHLRPLTGTIEIKALAIYNRFLRPSATPQPPERIARYAFLQQKQNRFDKAIFNAGQVRPECCVDPLRPPRLIGHVAASGRYGPSLFSQGPQRFDSGGPIGRQRIGHDPDHHEQHRYHREG